MHARVGSTLTNNGGDDPPSTQRNIDPKNISNKKHNTIVKNKYDEGGDTLEQLDKEVEAITKKKEGRDPMSFGCKDIK